MATVKPSKTLVGLRPSQDDLRILARLGKKLGLAESSIIRLALRVLAEKEGLSA